MRFFERIKDFLVRWDLMPILWPFGPKGQDGWIPLAIMAASAIASAAAKKKQADAANNANLAGQQSYNDWLRARKSGVDDIIGKIQQTGWNPFGVNELGGSSWNQGTSDSTTRSSFDRMIRQLVDPAQAAGKAKVEALMEGRLGQGRSDAEKIAHLVTINNQMEGAKNRALNQIGIKNLGTFQGAGASLGPEQQAAAARIAYLDPKNDLERQRQAEADFMGLMEQWKGQRQTGRETSRTTGSTYGFGGGSQQVGPDTNFLMNLLPPSPQAPMQTGQSPGWGFAGDLFGAAGNMAALWQANKQGGGGGAGPSPVANLFSGGGGGGGGPVTPTYVPFNPGFKTTLTAPLLK